MVGLLTIFTLLAGAGELATRPQILTPQTAEQSRVRPEPGLTSTAGTHCRRGEQVIYSCDFTGERVSVCRDDALVLYRFGPKGRPEIELGRETPPVRSNLRGSESSEMRVRFASGAYSYSIYDADLGQARGRESGVLVWRDGNFLTEHRCRKHGPLQRLHERRVQDLARDTDARYDAW